MRVSVDKDDPGFVPEHQRLSVKVIFNGIERHVITADEESFIVVFQRDANGRYVLDEGRKDLKRETLFGDVVVQGPER